MDGEWVLLAYRLPREPSSPRIALWRKLRGLGAALLQDGLVGLPLDSWTRERLEWLAEEVVEAGGEAHVWIATPTIGRQGQELAQRIAAAIADEYRAITRQAIDIQDADVVVRRRHVRRLRRELGRVRRRDYFPPPDRDVAIAAVERLALSVEPEAAAAVTL